MAKRRKGTSKSSKIKKKQNRSASKVETLLLKHSKAAAKGWKTRRANERKRSDAAKRGWETRRKNQQREKPVKPNNREYFVVLTFTTRKRGRTVTRRLYEAIVTLPDGATEDEVLKAYQEKIQEQHPKLHNREIEQLLFGENRGRRIKIVPRDEPGSKVPSGSVRVNDARNPAKRKGNTRRGARGKKA